MPDSKRDQDAAKGATETDDQKSAGNTSLQGQIGHRDQDPLLKDADTDFPEPGESPEHSGEPRQKNRVASSQRKAGSSPGLAPGSE